MAQIKFTGLLPSGAGATQYHADPGVEVNGPQAVSQGFVPPSCTVVGLTVNPTSNTTANTTTFEVYKNGVATGVKVTVGAASTTKVRDVAHTATFNGTTDVLDLASVRTGSLATTLTFAAVVATTIL